MLNILLILFCSVDNLTTVEPISASKKGAIWRLSSDDEKILVLSIKM